MAQIILRLTRIFALVFLLSMPTLTQAMSSPRLAQDAGNAESVEAEPRVKNVLFIISDDLKASALGCYGNAVCNTPNLDALARRGMLFERAYCNATWCAPSRQSLMFSRYLGTGNIGGEGVGSGPAGAHQPNLGQHFRENGFYSARVGKIYHMRVPGDIIAGTNGNDVRDSWTERFNSPGPEAHTPGDYACLNKNIFTRDLANRQSTRTRHRMFVTVKIDGKGTGQADYKSASKAIELLNQHKDDPFFLAVGLVRPHYPMVAPRSLFDSYSWKDLALPRVVKDDLHDIPKLGLGQTLSSKNQIGKFPDNQKRMWAGYYASVTFMDQQVGRIIAELDRLGLSESTAIVFTSDHGYHLGEHSFWQKSNLHEEVARVPLIIATPSGAATRSRSFVELVDLFPTMADWVGLKIPATVRGRSLVPILKDANASVRDSALVQHQGHLLRTDGWAYMRYQDETEELYDMKLDPNQFSNLAFEGLANQNQDRLIKMRAALKAKLKALGIKPGSN